MRQPAECLVIAGEPSGDQLAAELVVSLHRQWPGLRPRFFGAGGPAMAAAGVEITFDLTRHSVIGLVEALKKYPFFKRFFDELLILASAGQPDLILCVDFSGFNRRFARAIREAASRGSVFHNWRPRIVQFISPQVWASRPGRVKTMERDLDLLLSVFPFEKAWYARHAPGLRVEFVGHPIFDRHVLPQRGDSTEERTMLALLPGSRPSELARHLAPLLEAAESLKSKTPLRQVMVLPSRDLITSSQAERIGRAGIELRVGGLSAVLRQSALALASTGTVTLECAFFGVPTVAFYKTSWSTYQIGKRIVQVPFLAMPNLLAGRAIMPELVQHEATGERLAQEAWNLLSDPGRLAMARSELAAVMQSLGGPGACNRAADAVLRLLGLEPVTHRSDSTAPAR